MKEPCQPVESSTLPQVPVEGSCTPNNWSKVIPVIRTPLNFLALVALSCNAVFVVCATIMKEAELFKYCMHMFIAFVGIFGLMAVWSPGFLYHPCDMEGLRNPPANRPMVPTLVAVGCLVAYMVYHAFLKTPGT